MLTRVTNRQVNITFIDELNRTRSRLEEARNEISSGVRVADASDDPGRAAVIAQFQSTIQRIDRHQQRIEYAGGLLDQQDRVLDQSENLIVRAKEIATQAASETLSASQRATLSAEVFAIRDQFVGLGNTKYEGRYIYGGADDDDPPFDAQSYTNPSGGSDPASIRYVFDAEAGTSVTRDVEVSDDTTVRINTAGDGVFSNSIAAVERLGRALAGYATTPTSGTPDGGGAAYTFPAEYDTQTAHITAGIDTLEAARVELSRERNSVGGRMNQLDQAGDILDTLKLNIDESRAAYQDADIFEAASRLSTLETSLEGLLAAGARIQNLSLLDFLG